MKKLFTLLTLFILVTLTASAADEVYYKLTCSKGSHSAYATYTDVTINGMTWNAPGNQNLGNYWRIGFKEVITNGERTITAKSAMGSEISKIVISHNGLNSTANVKLNSVKVTVASDAKFSSIIEEVTISNPSIKQSTAGTFEFNPSTGITWSKDAFYKFTFNFTTNATSAKAIDLTKIEFFKSTSTSGKTATTLSFGSDWDGKEITKYIGEADFTCPTAALTPAVEGATITYSSSDENVATIVDGTIVLVDAGTTTISASYAGNDNYEASSASFTIKLEAKLPAPVFNLESKSYVTAGTKVKITAPESRSRIYYTIDNVDQPYSEGNTQEVEINKTTTIEATAFIGASSDDATVISDVTSATYYVKELSSIAISGTPNKTTYAPGDAFSTDGLTVTATYSDGSTADVTSNVSWTFDPATFATEDSKTVAVTATYNGKTATENYTVTVTAPSVSTNTYTLVTSTDELVDGAQYVLLTNKGDYAASSFDTNKITTVTSNNNYTLENNIVTVLSENVNVFTFKGDNTNGWTITDKDGVVYTSVDDNNLSSGTATVHTISFNNNVVAISAKGISTRKWMFNSTGSMIRNYKSGTGLYLYKSNGPVVNKPAKPTFSTTDDATTFTESLKVTITPAEGCKVKYQLGEAEAVTAADTNPVEVTLTETTTITASSVNDENVESDPNSATYTKVEPFESKTFTLVTSTENIVDGEYVLVSADGTKAASVLGSELTTVAIGDNTFSLSDDGVVTTLGESVNVFTLTKNAEGKFTITDKDGKKLESSSTANSIKATTNGGTFDISINSNGNVVISGYTNYLWKHNTSTDYIRNYKTTSTTDVQFLKLYKAGEVVVKPDVPTFDPVSGTTFTTESAAVTITAAEGCTLKYTLGDGVEQTVDNNTADVTVTPTAYTIKAKSVNADGVESAEATATYKFDVVAHVKNIAEFMALEENTTAIFDNPVIVLYDYSQPSTKIDETTGKYSNPEYIWVKDETGHTNIYFEVAIDPTNHQAKYENGDVIPAGFVAVKSYYTVGKYTQAKVETENNETFEKASLKRLADPVTITFDEFNALQVGSDAHIAKWNNTYVMIPKVTMAADETDKWYKTYFVYQDGVKATSNVFYNKYSDTRNETEIPLTKQGEDARVTMPTSSTKEYNVYGILQVFDKVWEIMPIRFVEYSAQTVTLKELVEAGNAGTTTEGTEYTILNDLRGVVALPGNVILAKDENGNAVDKVKPAGKSFMINAKSYFSDDTTESVNAKAQENYDQSNWVEIVLPTGVSASDYVDKIITGLSVKGQYMDTTNPRLVASATPAAGGATGAYTRNAMCPANFMGALQKCNSEENHGEYFFMTPKPNECVQVVWAIYNSTAKAFYIPQAEGSINTHAFKGAFGIDWTYNKVSETSFGEPTGLQDGNLYQFKAVVKKSVPGSTKAGKRNIAYDHTQDISGKYLIYPLDLASGSLVTGISNVAAAKTVKSVRYFNAMGMQLAEPAPGINIVVTTYTDGTATSQKVLK